MSRNLWILAALTMLLVIGPALLLQKKAKKSKHPAPTSQTQPKENIPPANPAPQELNPQAIGIRSEMKMTMAALFAAEKSFFTEYGRYTTDLNALGYLPEGKEIRSKGGFLTPFMPTTKESFEHPEVINFEQLLGDPKNNPDQRFVFSREAEGVRLEDAAVYCKKGCTASQNGFEFLMATNLDADPDLDVWTINEENTIEQVHDDLIAPGP